MRWRQAANWKHSDCTLWPLSWAGGAVKTLLSGPPAHIIQYDAAPVAAANM